MADVEAAVAGAPPAPPVPPRPAGAVEGAPAARAAAMRQAIGAAMARSKREIPHYHLDAELDLSAAMAWLARTNQDRPVAERLLPAVLLLKAVALAAREAPDMNGLLVDGSFRPSPAVHLGVAISLRRGGLVAPAIHDADRLSLPDLMRALADLVARTRSGGLRSSELADSTLTVTSLGDLGVDAVHGIIYPPQVALVGFGRIAERPRVVAGRIEAVPTVIASLAGDHRVSDGLSGARFLAEVGRRLREPEGL
jgi:pyruvate dehydrogenase E2 component (dihydrolipoamide acetyltransferase)